MGHVETIHRFHRQGKRTDTKEAVLLDVHLTSPDNIWVLFRFDQHDTTTHQSVDEPEGIGCALLFLRGIEEATILRDALTNAITEAEKLK